MPETTERDLTKSTLAIVLIGALLAACFWILRPFLPALIWALRMLHRSQP